MRMKAAVAPKLFHMHMRSVALQTHTAERDDSENTEYEQESEPKSKDVFILSTSQLLVLYGTSIVG